MASEEKSGLMDPEKELTCSICTEVLYQPLTLIDCLHTFCGSCLKEWFSWQAKHPTKSNPFTCPSCRASVLETKPNAMVTSLLEVFLRANPTRGKTDAEKSEIAKSYKPGDTVIPPISRRRRKQDEDEDEEDRQLIEEIRELSLVTAQGSQPADSRQAQGRTTGNARRERARDERDGEGRHRRREGDAQVRESPRGHVPTRVSDRARDTHRSRDVPSGPIEHQPSLRSLLSASDLDGSDIEEELARQIIEDGLLDGIDLSHIDVSQEEEISERIAEAYRRRHGDRVVRPRRSPRDSETVRPGAREGESGTGQRRCVRSHSASQQAREGPPGRSARASLDASSATDRRSRRTSDYARSSTSLVAASTVLGQTSDVARIASRSTTDLSNGPRSSPMRESRPSNLGGPGRRTTDPETRQATWRQHGEQQPRNATGQAGVSLHPQRPATTTEGDSAVSLASSMPPQGQVQDDASHPRDENRRPMSSGRDAAVRQRPQASSTGQPSPPASAVTGRNRAFLYSEPYISCNQCGKRHIEYDLHFNCAECDKGEFNICLTCYRQGKGCKHWYGFGYAALVKYDRLAPAGGYPSNHPLPHVLTGHRYLRPTQEPVRPGSSDSNRRLVTTEDPLKRLQAGVFCSICSSFANECFWKCDVCNDGEWGFCNKCVNAGKCCTHPLLPVGCLPSKEAPTGEGASATGAAARKNPVPPVASDFRGPWGADRGHLKPLSITTACNICRLRIQPSSTRFHCPQCNEGDYDICTRCYLKLCTNGKISPENGHRGWRRCLRGHRMVVIGFEDRDSGRRRVVVQDLVGGLALKDEATSTSTTGDDAAAMATDSGVRAADKWSWREGPDGRRVSKLISRGVAGTTSTSTSSSLPPTMPFPPDGGIGMRVLARWSYFPADAVTDELMFPRAAEITEVADINQDWYWGRYAGRTGLFPGGYVTVLGVVGSSSSSSSLLLSPS